MATQVASTSDREDLHRREGEVLRALKGERDRAVFELQKVRGELRRVTQQFELLREEHKGCAAHHKEAHRALEGVEAEYQKLRAADTANTLKSTTTIMELQQDINELRNRLADVTQQRQEAELARVEAIRRHDALLAQGSVRKQLDEAKTLLVSYESQQRNMQVLIDSQARSLAQLEGKLEEDTRRNATMIHRLEGQLKRTEDALAASQQRIVAQQQQYRTLLTEGRNVAAEVQRALALSLKQQPTLYKSGTVGLLAWLESYNLESLHSSLLHSGFTDVSSVMHITDADLIAMKQTVGTRRKFLGAAAQLREQYAAAPKGNESAAEPVQALDQWLRDFDAIVDAEERQATIQ